MSSWPVSLKITCFFFTYLLLSSVREVQYHRTEKAVKCQKTVEVFTFGCSCLVYLSSHAFMQVFMLGSIFMSQTNTDCRVQSWYIILRTTGNYWAFFIILSWVKLSVLSLWSSVLQVISFELGNKSADSADSREIKINRVSTIIKTMLKVSFYSDDPGIWDTILRTLKEERTYNRTAMKHKDTLIFLV